MSLLARVYAEKLKADCRGRACTGCQHSSLCYGALDGCGSPVGYQTEELEELLIERGVIDDKRDY